MIVATALTLALIAQKILSARIVVVSITQHIDGMSKMRQDFRDIVAKAMAEQNVTIYALSQMTKVSWPTLNRWLKRRTNINHRALEAIFHALKITVTYP